MLTVAQVSKGKLGTFGTDMGPLMEGTVVVLRISHYHLLNMYVIPDIQIFIQSSQLPYK